MHLEKMIRPCGGGYQYCDGHCAECGFNNTTYSTTTNPNSPTFSSITTLDNTPPTVTFRAAAGDDGFSKPTREQYENSKAAKASLADWIRRSKKRQEELMDELLKERTQEKEYQGMYDAHKDLVRRYEIYEELATNV